MTKVYVCIPNAGELKTQLSGAMLKLAGTAHEYGCELQWNCRQDKPTDNLRNQMIRKFVEGTDCEYLFFMDSDNPPLLDENADGTVNNPLELIAEDLDVVACPTPIWNPKALEVGRFPIVWNVFDDLGEKGFSEITTNRFGLREIDAAGSGCVIISRRVLEHPDMRHAFRREWNEWGEATWGSDLLFCRRVRQAGFKVWASFRHICHHFKTRDLTELYKLVDMRDIRHANAPNRNTPEYWDGEWAKRGERNLEFYPFIVEKLKEWGCKRVLDYGCGRGDLLEKIDEAGINGRGLDISNEGVTVCRNRGLFAELYTDGDDLAQPFGFVRRFDAIVSTEVLEHLDDDVGKLNEFFEYTDRVIYSVPFDCLPPGVEPEHRRVYTEEYVRRITPHLKQVVLWGNYLIAICEKEAMSDGTECKFDVPRGDHQDDERRGRLRHAHAESGSRQGVVCEHDAD